MRVIGFGLLSLGLLLGCSGAPRLRTAPPTLAGLALHHEVGGQKAVSAIERLHNGAEIQVRSAWIAHYGEGPSAMLYVGVAKNGGEAGRLLEAMKGKIAEGGTPFQGLEELRWGEGSVYVMTGQGQLHFLFRDESQVVWLSADPVVAHRALREVFAGGRGAALGSPGRSGPELPEAYRVPVRFGDVGPRLLALGAIELRLLEARYARSGRALTARQRRILIEGTGEPVLFSGGEARFLLDFFWALGLTNRIALLAGGPMMQRGGGELGRYASVGGWTLGSRPATALYASAEMVPLSAEQQGRLEEVAYGVYRPCCDNPTAFPDCSHGMAMLGLLTLMAAEGATLDQMFSAARAASAFWFPEQALEVAIFLEAVWGTGFSEGEAQAFTGRDVFSAAGFRTVHQWLVDHGLAGGAASLLAPGRDVGAAVQAC